MKDMDYSRDAGTAQRPFCANWNIYAAGSGEDVSLKSLASPLSNLSAGALAQLRQGLGYHRKALLWRILASEGRRYDDITGGRCPELKVHFIKLQKQRIPGDAFTRILLLQRQNIW